MRGLLDGHTWLSRALATRGHYPAIDVLASLSRLMPEVTTKEHRQAAFAMRELLATYRDHEDLISIGAYRRGSNRTVDAAIDMQADLNRYLRQAVEEPASVDQARDGLLELHRQFVRRQQANEADAAARTVATPTPPRKG
jgi:flagellum-specific ATP synthase